jgi:hypothetical protein
MPKAAYWRYLPLSYTRPIRQSAGSAVLNLYGVRSDPNYRDTDPVDGIDDSRHEVLHRMGIRFAPYLVLNTTAVPMDWKKFMNGRTSWPLFIETWNQAAEGGELIAEEQVDWLKLSDNPCPNPDATTPSDNDDCRLLSLLREFDPEAPASEWYRKFAADPRLFPFKVLYWNFPGHNEHSWNEEYRDPISGELPKKYWGFPKTYLHPFIEEVRSNTDGLLGYELVLQYWFFYSWNDGGNNHEGDWEHVNIIVAPKSGVTRPQTAEEIAFMLSGGGETPDAGDDYVVIKRVDYYFHENVWTFDYSSPNVYLPRDEWEAQMDALPQDRVDQHRVWRLVRERAYEDAAETVINTHIVGFIGADNKGTDQILAAPGGKNRDSHGTYPFPGLYKNVGPAGASEGISAPFNYRKYFDGPRPGREDGRLGRGSVLRLDREDRVEIVPDWERVHDLMLTDPMVRREWSWLVLPIRWGFPAAESPFAGTVGHASTGNLAPQAGSLNPGWNRSGAGSGFHTYSPHRYSGYFLLGWQDGFKNTWGFFNLTIPTAAMLPPLDLVVRILGAPIELATQRSPTFLKADQVPYRFMSAGLGVITQDIPDEFANLFRSTDQYKQIIDALGYGGVPAESLDVPVLGHEVDQTSSFAGNIGFYVGRRFVSENAFWAPRTTITTTALDSGGERRDVTADLKMYEYAGSMRYNLKRGQVQPYAKLGYGITWFRLEEIAVGGVQIPTPKTTTAHPFTWHWGLGLEYVPIASFAPPPRGLDFGLRLEYAQYHHSLSMDKFVEPISVLGQVPSDIDVTRQAVTASMTIGF